MKYKLYITHCYDSSGLNIIEKEKAFSEFEKTLCKPNVSFTNPVFMSWDF